MPCRFLFALCRAPSTFTVGRHARNELAQIPPVILLPMNHWPRPLFYVWRAPVVVPLADSRVWHYIYIMRCVCEIIGKYGVCSMPLANYNYSPTKSRQRHATRVLRSVCVQLLYYKVYLSQVILAKWQRGSRLHHHAFDSRLVTATTKIQMSDDDEYVYRNVERESQI